MALLIADNSPIINKNIVKQVKNDKYNAVIIPNLCLTHSVKMKPSGHFFLMMGPNMANPRMGIAPQSVYTSNPCNPAMFAIWAYVEMIPTPIASTKLVLTN